MSRGTGFKMAKVASSYRNVLKHNDKSITELGVPYCRVVSRKSKSLKTLINHIYDNSPCVLVDYQVRKKSNMTLIVKVRKTTVDKLLTGGYIKVVNTVIHLQPDAVVMLSKRKQIEWMTKHCKG